MSSDIDQATIGAYLKIKAQQEATQDYEAGQAALRQMTALLHEVGKDAGIERYNDVALELERQARQKGIG